MDFGLCLTPFSPPEGNAFASYRRIARTALDSGFRDLVAGENYVSHPHWTPPGVQLLTALSAVLGSGPRYIAGIALVAVRNPVVLAEEITLLDQASEGRSVVGVGLGWRREVFCALGQPLRGRVARMVSNLEIMQGLWRGDWVDSDAPYCRLSGARSAQLPIQRSGPPVWMAAHSDKAVERAARLADTWLMNPHARRQVLRRQLGLFQQARSAAGRCAPEELPLRREVFVSLDGARARAEALQRLVPLYDSLVAWGHDEAMPRDDTMRRPFNELCTDRFVVGEPDEVIAELRTYESELGATHLIARIAFPGMSTSEVCDRIAAFGDLVISRMAVSSRPSASLKSP